MVAPAGWLAIASVAIGTACSATTSGVLLPAATWMTRVAGAKPDLLNTTVCCPGVRLRALNGEVPWIALSTCTCAPEGIVVICSSPLLALVAGCVGVGCAGVEAPGFGVVAAGLGVVVAAVVVAGLTAVVVVVGFPVELAGVAVLGEAVSVPLGAGAAFTCCSICA